MIQKIRKAKITKGRTLEVELIEINEDQTENEVIKKCSQLIHNDLQKTFDKLKIHLVKICDLKEGDNLDLEDYNSDEHLEKFKVTSFSISGNDDSEGVTITGQKELKDGKVLNLNTPFTQYVDEVNEGYELGTEMAADIAACVYEVEQYLFNQKYAIKQLEIPFGENNPDGAEFDQQASEVAGAVLEKVADSILGTEKKRGRKKKQIEMAGAEA